MFTDSENIDFSPDVAPLRRTSWLIYGTALAALLLLLGHNALTATEGELAESIRCFAAGKNLFLSGQNWYPESGASYFFGRIGGVLAMLLGSNEWSVRILTVVPAMLMLAGTMRLTGMIFDRRIEALAGWLLIGSYGFLYWGRHGSWFMMSACLVLWLALTALSAGHRNGRFFVLALLTVLGTALFGMVFLLPAATLAVFAKRDMLPEKISHAGLLILAALVVVILLLFGLGYSEDLSFAENLTAVANAVRKSMTVSWQAMIYPGYGSNEWYRTPENLPRLLIPWFPVTATVVAGMICRYRELPDNVRKLLVLVMLMLVLTGIYPGKRWQFMLPLLPFFIVLTAGGMAGDCGNKNWNRIAGIIMTWGCTLAASLAVAAAVTYPLWNLLLKVTPPAELMIGMPLLGLLALGMLIFDTGPTSMVERSSGIRGAWSGYVLGAVALSVALWCVAIPSLTKFRMARAFWQVCHAELRNTSGSSIIFFGDMPHADELFYLALDDGVTAVPDYGELKEHLAQTSENSAAVIVRQHRSGGLLKFMEEHKWRKTAEFQEGESLKMHRRQSVGQKHYVMYKFEKK